MIKLSLFLLKYKFVILGILIAILLFFVLRPMFKTKAKQFNDFIEQSEQYKLNESSEELSRELSRSNEEQKRLIYRLISEVSEIKDLNQNYEQNAINRQLARDSSDHLIDTILIDALFRSMSDYFRANNIPTQDN